MKQRDNKIKNVSLTASITYYSIIFIAKQNNDFIFF